MFDGSVLTYSEDGKRVNLSEEFILSDDLYELQELVIPEGIEEIGSFWEAYGLKSITLPSTLKRLHCCTFYNTDIEIKVSHPYDILILTGDDYFEGYGIIPVKKIFLEGSLDIGVDAFKDWILLEEVVITENIGTIEKGAFAGCENLKKVIFQGDCEFIAKGAFNGCDKLEEINIPLGTEISPEAFNGRNGWRNFVDLALKSGLLWSNNFSICPRNLIPNAVKYIIPNTEAKRELYQSCSWSKNNDNYIGTSLSNGATVFLNDEKFKEIKKAFQIRKTYEYKLLNISYKEVLGNIYKYGEEGFELIHSVMLSSYAEGTIGLPNYKHEVLLIFKRELLV